MFGRWTLRRRIAGLVVGAVVMAGLLALPGSAATVSFAYPDLVAQPATDFSLDEVGGSRVLRFSTLSANLGQSPLHLARHDQNGARSVWQYALDDAGDLTPLKAVGDFEYHPAHDHIHFTDYAAYVLRRPDGSNAQGLAQSGTKTTFCIMDTTRVDRKWPGAPKRAEYTRCEATYQGMSLGWGDRYGSHLADQWVVLDKLMADAAANSGDWVLEIVIDPGRKLMEVSTMNNTSVVPICLDLLALTVAEGACQGGEPDPDGKPGNGRGRPPR
jgi:hypothetical protein